MDLQQDYPVGPSANTRKRNHDGTDGDYPDKRAKLESSYVQITGTPQEIDGRVKSYLTKKREQSNQSNQLEFIDPNHAEGEWKSARTATQTIERNNQIKIYEVENEVGPQSDRAAPPPKAAKKSGAAEKKQEPSGDELPPAVEERLRNMEEHLKLYPQLRAAPKDVYVRLKKLEDRVLALERRGIYPPRTGAGRGGAAAGADDFDDDEWMPRAGSSRSGGGGRAPRAHADAGPKTAPVLPPLPPSSSIDERDDIDAKMAELREKLARQTPQKPSEHQADSAGLSAPTLPDIPLQQDSHHSDHMHVDSSQTKDADSFLDAFGSGT